MKRQPCWAAVLGLLVVERASNAASVGEVRVRCVCIKRINKWARGNSQWSIERRIQVGKYYLDVDG